MPAKGVTLLIDAPSLIYRAHFSVPDSVKGDDGQPVNAAYGFLNMLARLLADLGPKRCACCLDGDWRPEWRVNLVESYKAHRVALVGEEADVAVERQTEMLVRLLKLAGVATVGSAECEAEDVIATLARRTRGPIAIVSGDRDLFQLVRDPDAWVLYPKRGVSELVRVDEAEIRRRYNIPGRAYADFAVLRGDPSDGLPGVRGVGEKTASMLIEKYGSLEAVLRASEGARSGPLAKVAADADYVRRAERVVRMESDCAIGDAEIDLPLRRPSPKLPSIAEPLGVSGPIGRLLDAIGVTG
jgi:5'-3' exonuclease